MIQDLLDEGVNPRRILRVQFDDLETLGRLPEPILRISDWFERRVAPKRFNSLASDGEPAYLFFDEIQNIETLGRAVEVPGRQRFGQGGGHRKLGPAHRAGARLSRRPHPYDRGWGSVSHGDRGPARPGDAGPLPPGQRPGGPSEKRVLGGPAGIRDRPWSIPRGGLPSFLRSRRLSPGPSREGRGICPALGSTERDGDQEGHSARSAHRGAGPQA